MKGERKKRDNRGRKERERRVKEERKERGRRVKKERRKSESKVKGEGKGSKKKKREKRGRREYKKSHMPSPEVHDGGFRRSAPEGCYPTNSIGNVHTNSITLRLPPAPAASAGVPTG